MNNMKTCPDCGVYPGINHISGCDVEQCAECGGQKISCDCKTTSKNKIAWSGECPGIMECREFGWYAKFIRSRGWISCDKYDDGASEDLNRIMASGAWDKIKGRFVL